MNAVLAVGIIAFLLCLATTPLVRDLFLKYDIVDQPDTDRKFHLKPIPRVGGIAIVFSYATALGIMLLLAPRGAAINIQHGKLFVSLLPAAALVFLVGLLDDLFNLKPRYKLLGQLAAASLAVALGARLSLFHNLPHAAWITIPLSVVWLIGCSNAVNLIDGLDGLASGVGLFATITTLLAALATGNIGLAMATVPLVGCLLAFLKYNFSPASVFLGDCGSLTIGFMLGCFGLVWSERSGTLIGMAAPLMALALPLIDVSLSIGRRWMRNVPIFQGDRGHIHHMVLARGFKPHVATLILYAVSATAAALALLASFSHHQAKALVLLVFLALVWAGINYLGYIELSAARRTLSHKTVFRVLKEEIYLKDLERSLAKAQTTDDLWKIVRKTAEDMRFASVELLFNGHSFTATLDHASFKPSFGDAPVRPSWNMTLAIGHKGHLTLTHTDEASPPRLMASVLGILQDSLCTKQLGTPLTPAPVSETIETRVSQVA